MKRIFTFVLSLLLGQVMFAQYYVLQTTGTSSPYVFNNTGTSIITTGNEVLSTWQSLPFTWNYFNNPVTGYFASDNGYITFDNAATVSNPTNIGLPSASAPLNAIMAFWDDFTVDAGSGNPDLVRTWTYGTQPNRTHCIQWWSMSFTGSTVWVYTTIRIHEGADFDIVLDYGSSGAAAISSGTIGGNDATGANGIQVGASPSYAYPTIASDANDDIVYEFHAGSQPAYDLSITTSDLNGTVAIGNNTVSGSLTNFGANAVTSFDLNYKVDNEPTVTATINAVNITASGGTYNYSHPTVWNVPTGGQVYSLDIWATNINGNVDEVPANDHLVVSPLISALGISTTHSVLVEEFTGAWCQFCPDGQVRMGQILAANPDRAYGVSVHDGDLMQFTDGIRSAYSVSSYPSGQVDRFLFPGEAKVPHNRGAWASNVAARMNAFSPADISISSTYNSGTRAVDVTVTTDFVDYYGGDLRMVLYVVEDSVTGPGTGYDQVNAYNGDPSHPYYQAGNPIMGYNHRHTLRDLPWGAFGNPGVIPSSVSQNDTYTATANFSLPLDWDDTRISLIASLHKYDADVLKGEMLNTMEIHLGENTVAVDAPTTVAVSSVSPNPVSDIGRINVSFTEITEASFEIYNTMGQRVSLIKEGTYTPGEHGVFFDVTTLESGVYIISVRANGQSFSEKLVVTH